MIRNYQRYARTPRSLSESKFGPYTRADFAQERRRTCALTWIIAALGVAFLVLEGCRAYH
jgi:hypothetical protein